MQPEAVLVRAPLPAVRTLLVPENLPALMPGLGPAAGGARALRLWRPGGVSTHGVRVQRTADGGGTLLLSAAGAPVGFRLTLAVRPAAGNAPSRCLLEGRVESDGADPAVTAALRHALLRLVPEVAAAAEHAAAQDGVVDDGVPRDVLTQREPVVATTPRRSRATAAVVAAAVAGGLLAAVVVRGRARKAVRRA